VDLSDAAIPRSGSGTRLHFSFAPPGLASTLFAFTLYGVGCVLSPLRGLAKDTSRRIIHSIYSIVAVIFAVFSSIADTEQYFSLESLTASSIAFCDILPLTRYVSLMWV